MARFGIKCLLCDEIIILEGLEVMIPSKICEKCKKFWSKILMEEILKEKEDE